MRRKGKRKQTQSTGIRCCGNSDGMHWITSISDLLEMIHITPVLKPWVCTFTIIIGIELGWLVSWHRINYIYICMYIHNESGRKGESQWESYQVATICKTLATDYTHLLLGHADKYSTMNSHEHIVYRRSLVEDIYRVVMWDFCNEALLISTLLCEDTRLACY